MLGDPANEHRTAYAQAIDSFDGYSRSCRGFRRFDLRHRLLHKFDFPEELRRSDAELLRLEYVKIGFVFWLLTCGIVFIPLGAFLLTRRVRKSSGLPHFHAGLIGTSLNATALLLPPLFLDFLRRGSSGTCRWRDLSSACEVTTALR